MSSRRLVPTGILARYVGRSLIRPFILGFSVVTFLLTLDFLLDYLDLFLGKGIPFLTVARLFVLGLGWMIALSVPCGVLVAALMAYGQMSQDNEVTALRASGVSLFSVMVPSFLAATLVAVGLVAFNNWVLPETNHSFANLAAQIHRMRPTANIQEGIFIDDFDGYNLFIRRLDDRTGAMRDILIIDASENRASPRTIVARRGDLRFDPQHNAIDLTLREGEIHEADPASPDGRYRRLAFGEQKMRLQGAGDGADRSGARNRGQREMSVRQMKEEIAKLSVELESIRAEIDTSLLRHGYATVADLPSLDPTGREPGGLRRILGAIAGFLFGRPSPPPAPDLEPEKRQRVEEIRVRIFQADGVRKRIDQYRVEIHKKFSIPFACLVFVLVGAPLGMRARRGGIAVGFLSVAFFLFYYLCLIGGEQLADRGLLRPWLSMWLPNAILGILGGYLTYRIATQGFSMSAGRSRRA